MGNRRYRQGGGLGAFIVFIGILFGLMGAAQAANPNDTTQREQAWASWYTTFRLDSMGQDPDAIACIAADKCTASRAIDPSTGHSAFDGMVEACYSAHVARTQNLFGHKPSGGKRARKPWLLKPLNLTDEVPHFVDLRNVCPVSENEQMLVQAAAQRVLEAAQALRKAAGIVVASLATPPPAFVQTSMPAPPKKASKKDVVEVPIASNGARDVCPMPAHTELRAATPDHVELFVRHGADFGDLRRSTCWISHFKLDPEAVIEGNKIEDTIPYCRTGKKIGFDLARQSGKITLGSAANSAYFKECTDGGGEIGLILQERQRVSIARLTNDASAAAAKKGAANLEFVKIGDIRLASFDTSSDTGSEWGEQTFSLFRCNLGDNTVIGEDTFHLPAVRTDADRVRLVLNLVQPSNGQEVLPTPGSSRGPPQAA